MPFVLDVYDAYYRIGASTSWDWRHTYFSNFLPRCVTKNNQWSRAHGGTMPKTPHTMSRMVRENIMPLAQVADWILLGESLSKWRQK